MINGLLVKCAILIMILHGMRAISRRIGPRWSGLILGLPSSTAILLALCGQEKGSAGAAEMAEASFLGLVAAVSLPLAYAQAVRLGWRLPGALAAAVTGYFTVALTLGILHPIGPSTSLGISLSAVLVASYLAGRIPLPEGRRSPFARWGRWIVALRSAIPAGYVAVIGIAQSAAQPSWAGLVSTFPSMSTVVLAVTHLEEGPAQASRIAKALPSGNLSTVAFLAVFRYSCPEFGIAWGMVGGYVTALTILAVNEGIARRAARSPSISVIDHRVGGKTRDLWDGARRAWIRADVRSIPRSPIRGRRSRDRGFSPLFETLAF